MFISVLQKMPKSKGVKAAKKAKIKDAQSTDQQITVANVNNSHAKSQQIDSDLSNV